MYLSYACHKAVLNDKDEIRLQISEKIEKTDNQVITYRKLCQPVASDCSFGCISKMDAINKKSGNEASMHKDEDEHSTLKAAFGKINDDFGKCIRCSVEIPRGRILIRPESLHCVIYAGGL